VVEILIGLGANLGDPPGAFREALAVLDDRHSVVSVSSLYRARAVGPAQPDYHNAAALLEVDCCPLSLLAECLELEAVAGRRREEEVRWGPRTLDLDLLMANGLVRRGPTLELPHPRFHERAFALIPAAELAPEWIHPVLGRTIADLADTAQGRDSGGIFDQLPFEWKRRGSQVES
jgi:2-amino-4-hydroxy-6-hydroxymethyldihydropteridine diphosphokinase